MFVQLPGGEGREGRRRGRSSNAGPGGQKHKPASDRVSWRKTPQNISGSSREMFDVLGAEDLSGD